MPALRNIREAGGRVFADFQTDDGRPGCISISVEEYRAHGEPALQQEAEACCRAARHHGYVRPELDRYRELRD